MGKKRRRQDEEAEAANELEEKVPDTAGEEAAAAADVGGQDGDAYEGSRHGKRSKSLVNEETSTYLEEIVAHFKTLVDDEERALLVGNVLEEIAGKEVKVAGDPVCSRYVETLMAAAQPQQLLKFLTSVADVDGFFTLVSSPFGSHAVEKLLVRLDSQVDAMTQDEYDEFQRMLTLLTDSICPHLYDYITDRYATHVVRRLLCLLAGRNILPPPGKQQQQQLLGQEGAAKRSKSDPPSGLAAKLGTAAVPGGGGKGGASAAAAMAAELLGLGPGGDEAPPCRLPDLVARFVAVVCSDDYVGPVVSELVYSTYACPFLQALLRAAASDRKSLRQLVPVLLGATTFNDSAKGGAGVVFEGCKDEEVAAMFTDPSTSHLVEVLLQVLPKSLFEEFFRRFLSSRLAELAHHPSANFVVQAALGAVPSKELAKAMFDSLSGLLPDLLRKRRSGVVAAMVAACGRHGVCQKEVCAALAAALSGLPQWAGLKGDAALAPALLCLDSVPLVGANEPFSAATIAASKGGGGSLPRLSPVGCSILIQVLRYGQGACRSFTDSVVALQPHDAARVGADPAGSRVLEALLEGNAPAKVKASLLAALAGHWDVVAGTAPGSFLVETAYRVAEPPAKEAIVSRLAGATKALEVTRWGPALLSRVGAEAYARDPEQWRRHAASASKTLGQFAKLFGADAGGGDGAGGKGGKGKGTEKEKGPAGAKDGAVDKGAAAGETGRKAKKAKKGAEEEAGGEEEGEEGAAAARVEAEEDGGGGEGQARKGKKEKKKKRREAEAEEGHDGGEDGAKGGGAGRTGVGKETEEGVGGEGPKVKKSKKRKQEAEEGEPGVGGGGAGDDGSEGRKEKEKGKKSKKKQAE